MLLLPTLVLGLATGALAQTRITYQTLPTGCAQSCVQQAIHTIPCRPFTAECACALPSGRYAYKLPTECARDECSAADADAVDTWWGGVCKGIPTNPQMPTSTSSRSSTSVRSSVSSSTPTALPSCANDGVACPANMLGGCCPSGFTCNLLDCQPPNSSTASPPTSPSVVVDAIHPATFFPPCTHDCITPYLLATSCSLTPLNSTCLCRLHEFYSCFASCPPEVLSTFTALHQSTCADQWYFQPYSTKAWRWCDLIEGPSGRPWGWDAGRGQGDLGDKCPDWWHKLSGGKAFGVVLGILVACLIALWGCKFYWEGVGKRVTELDRIAAGGAAS